MELHQKRGNMENFIREEKYSYDLKHFPCQKLDANRAYGLLAQVAHNMLRYVSVLMKPDKPHYSKKLRKRFIFHAGKVVKTARQLFLKITEAGYEEVMRLSYRRQEFPYEALRHRTKSEGLSLRVGLLHI